MENLYFVVICICPEFYTSNGSSPSFNITVVVLLNQTIDSLVSKSS